MEIKYIEYGKGDENKRNKFPLIRKGEEEARTSDDHNEFENCGRLLNENEVVIDIDCFGREHTKKILDTLKIDTYTVLTKRGAHLYFTFSSKKVVQEAEAIPKLGFPVEYKRIRGETKSVTIKQNGEFREVYNESPPMEIPYYLMQIGKCNDLRGYGDGQRYNTLLSQLNGVRDNRLNVLTCINELIFEEPMGNESFISIAKAGNKMVEAPTKQMLESQPNMDVDYILEKCEPCKLDTQVFYNINGEYTSDGDLIDRFIFKEFPFHTSYRINEIKTQVSMRCDIRNGTDFPINFNNGRLEDGNWYDLKYSGFTPYNIRHDYNPDAERTESFGIFMDFITGGDKEYEEYIFQVYAASLIPKSSFRAKEPRFHISYGDGGNGKGEMAKLMIRIFGMDNISSIKIVQMADKDHLLSIRHKLLNLGEDVKNVPINDDMMEAVKNVSASDVISKRGLYKDPRQYLFTTNLIFSSNHILKSFEKGNSFKRRIYYLPYNYSIHNDVKNNPDSKFNDAVFDGLKSKETHEYVVKRLIETYLKMMEHNGYYQESKKVQAFMESFHNENDNTSMWVEDIVSQLNEAPNEVVKEEILCKYILLRPSKEVYDDYCIWAETDGLKPIGEKSFKEIVCGTFDLKVQPRKINKVSRRVYVRK